MLFVTPFSFSCARSPALLAASKNMETQRRSLSVSQEDVSDKLDVRLRKDVKLLGGILGHTIEKHSGGLVSWFFGWLYYYNIITVQSRKRAKSLVV